VSPDLPKNSPEPREDERHRVRIAHLVAAALCGVQALAMVSFAVWVLIAGRAGPVDYEAGIVVFSVVLSGILAGIGWALTRDDTRWRGAALTLQIIFALMMQLPGQPAWVVMLARAPFIIAALALVAAIFFDNRQRD